MIPAAGYAGIMRKSMKRTLGKPGNFLYPSPVVMVGCASSGESVPNLITVAWAGTVCSEPPMLSIAIRRERYSHGLIRESGVFSVNLVNRKLVRACDFCGCRSGREDQKTDMYGKKIGLSGTGRTEKREDLPENAWTVRSAGDKFAACHLTPTAGVYTGAPCIEESPVILECRVRQVLELGSHDLFIADILGISAEECLFDEKGGLHLEKADLIAYSHGKYQALSDVLGTFGYSVRKKQKTGSTKKRARRG